MSDETRFESLLAFDTDHPEFARGFEAGRIWTLLQEDPDALNAQPIHASNAEMIMRMLEALDTHIAVEFSSDETWMYLAGPNA